jgi:hypothetical protein
LHSLAPLLFFSVCRSDEPIILILILIILTYYSPLDFTLLDPFHSPGF